MLCTSIDDFDNIKIAYSFGISKNIQFDKALADKGIDVFMYDHTINSLNDENLNQFKYIAIEYHFDDEKNIQDKYLYHNVLKKISKTHQPFYVRCNGNRGHVVNFGNNRICHIMEVSYIIRKGNRFIKDDTIYPIYDKFEYIQPQLNKLEVNLNILQLFVD